MSKHTVFVLGAGFTRAFCPTAPLLIYDWGVPELKKKFSKFRYASLILEEALPEGTTDPRINLERLMTRVMGMPYDTSDARHELALLGSNLMRSLTEKIPKATDKDIDHQSLRKFAELVLNSDSTVVTFNYDEILDSVLGDIPIQGSGTKWWNQDTGYGFYCHSSLIIATAYPPPGIYSETLLLKLHGSINWRARLGERSSYGPSEILHHNPQAKLGGYSLDLIESHLETSPFIIPPVLVKSELTAHPVLSAIWRLAYNKISAAQKIIFVGYSLPETDLAAQVLFRESIRNGSSQGVQEFEIVNLSDTPEGRDKIKKSYKSLIPQIIDSQFNFDGAKEWLNSFNCHQSAPNGTA